MNITKEQLEVAVANSTTLKEIQEKLGYTTYSGSRQQKIKKLLEQYDIDTSNLIGQSWNKNNFDYTRFRNGNAIKVAQAKAALVALRGHKCEQCGLDKWQGKDIPLEIHHCDGNHLNNDLTNLQLLCPNCHALTENWRGRNISTNNLLVTDEALIEALQISTSIRQALLKVGLTGAGGNYDRAYKLVHENQIEHLLK